MTPRPSKKPFGYPVPLEAFDAFCHPYARHIYHLPVLLPSGMLAAANGWMALKAERWDGEAPDDATPPFLARWDENLKWGPRSRWQDSDDWLDLDRITGSLFRFGARPIWEKGGLRWHLRRHPAVRVGNTAVVPLALLQLVARLPKAQIRHAADHRQPLPFRFNRGVGLIANHATALLGEEATAIFTTPLRP